MKYKGQITARLIDKNTGRIRRKCEIINQIVDDIYTMMFYTNRDIDPLRVYIGFDDDDSIAPNNPSYHWGDISGKMITNKSRSPVDMGNQNYEYRCLYPDASFPPPSTEDREVNLIALRHDDGATLYAYKKMTTPIIQTTNDYLEIIYTLSAITG